MIICIINLVTLCLLFLQQIIIITYVQKAICSQKTH